MASAAAAALQAVVATYESGGGAAVHAVKRDAAHAAFALASAVNVTPRAELVESQPKVEAALRGLIERCPLTLCASTTRLAASAMVATFQLGDARPVRDMLAALCKLTVTSKAPAASRAAAAYCVGELFASQGVGMAAYGAPLVSAVAKALKSTDGGLRGAAIVALRRGLVGLGAAAGRVLADSVKVIGKAAGDKLDAVRGHAACAMQAVAGTVATGGLQFPEGALEVMLKSCLKGLRDPVTHVRTSFALAFGALLAAAVVARRAEAAASAAEKERARVDAARNTEGGDPSAGGGEGADGEASAGAKRAAKMKSWMAKRMKKGDKDGAADDDDVGAGGGVAGAVSSSTGGSLFGRRNRLRKLVSSSYSLRSAIHFLAAVWQHSSSTALATTAAISMACFMSRVRDIVEDKSIGFLLRALLRLAQLGTTRTVGIDVVHRRACAAYVIRHGLLRPHPGLGSHEPAAWERWSRLVLNTIVGLLRTAGADATSSGDSGGLDIGAAAFAAAFDAPEASGTVDDSRSSVSGSGIGTETGGAGTGTGTGGAGTAADSGSVGTGTGGVPGDVSPGGLVVALEVVAEEVANSADLASALAASLTPTLETLLGHPAHAVRLSAAAALRTLCIAQPGAARAGVLRSRIATLRHTHSQLISETGVAATAAAAATASAGGGNGGNGVMGDRRSGRAKMRLGRKRASSAAAGSSTASEMSSGGGLGIPGGGSESGLGVCGVEDQRSLARLHGCAVAIAALIGASEACPAGLPEEVEQQVLDTAVALVTKNRVDASEAASSSRVSGASQSGRERSGTDDAVVAPAASGRAAAARSAALAAAAEVEAACVQAGWSLLQSLVSLGPAWVRRHWTLLCGLLSAELQLSSSVLLSKDAARIISRSEAVEDPFSGVDIAWRWSMVSSAAACTLAIARVVSPVLPTLPSALERLLEIVASGLGLLLSDIDSLPGAADTPAPRTRRATSDSSAPGIPRPLGRGRRGSSATAAQHSGVVDGFDLTEPDAVPASCSPSEAATVFVMHATTHVSAWLLEACTMLPVSAEQVVRFHRPMLSAAVLCMTGGVVAVSAAPSGGGGGGRGETQPPPPPFAQISSWQSASNGNGVLAIGLNAVGSAQASPSLQCLYRSDLALLRGAGERSDAAIDASLAGVLHTQGQCLSAVEAEHAACFAMWMPRARVGGLADASPDAMLAETSESSSERRALVRIERCAADRFGASAFADDAEADFDDSHCLVSGGFLPHSLDHVGDAVATGGERGVTIGQATAVFVPAAKPAGSMDLPLLPTSTALEPRSRAVDSAIVLFASLLPLLPEAEALSVIKAVTAPLRSSGAANSGDSGDAKPVRRRQGSGASTDTPAASPPRVRFSESDVGAGNVASGSLKDLSRRERVVLSRNVVSGLLRLMRTLRASGMHAEGGTLPNWLVTCRAVLGAGVCAADPIVRCGSGQALGELACVGGAAFATDMVASLQTQLRESDAARKAAASGSLSTEGNVLGVNGWAGAVFAVAAIRRSAWMTRGRLQLGKVEDVVIFDAGRETKQPVRTAALHAWWLLLDSAGSDFGRYVQPTLALLDAHLMTESAGSMLIQTPADEEAVADAESATGRLTEAVGSFTTDGDGDPLSCVYVCGRGYAIRSGVSLCLARILNALVAGVGPELVARPEVVERCLSVLTSLAGTVDPAVRRQVVSVVHSFAMYAPSLLPQALVLRFLRNTIVGSEYVGDASNGAVEETRSIVRAGSPAVVGMFAVAAQSMGAALSVRVGDAEAVACETPGSLHDALLPCLAGANAAVGWATACTDPSAEVVSTAATAVHPTRPRVPAVADTVPDTQARAFACSEILDAIRVATQARPEALAKTGVWADIWLAIDAVLAADSRSVAFAAQSTSAFSYSYPYPHLGVHGSNVARERYFSLSNDDGSDAENAVSGESTAGGAAGTFGAASPFSPSAVRTRSVRHMMTSSGLDRAATAASLSASHGANGDGWGLPLFAPLGQLSAPRVSLARTHSHAAWSADLYACVLGARECREPSSASIAEGQSSRLVSSSFWQRSNAALKLLLSFVEMTLQSDSAAIANRIDWLQQCRSVVTGATDDRANADDDDADAVEEEDSDVTDDEVGEFDGGFGAAVPDVAAVTPSTSSAIGLGGLRADEEGVPPHCQIDGSLGDSWTGSRWPGKLVAVAVTRYLLQRWLADHAPAALTHPTAEQRNALVRLPLHIVKQISSVLAIGGAAAVGSEETGGSVMLQHAALQLLIDAVDAFSRVSDPLAPSSPLLEQSQAQLLAAVRPALTPGAHPGLRDAACELAARLITCGVTTDAVAVKRLLRQVVPQGLAEEHSSDTLGAAESAVASTDTSGFGLKPFLEQTQEFASFSAATATRALLARVVALADLYCATMSQTSSAVASNDSVSGLSEEVSRAIISGIRPHLDGLSAMWAAIACEGAALSVRTESTAGAGGMGSGAPSIVLLGRKGASPSLSSHVLVEGAGAAISRCWALCAAAAAWTAHSMPASARSDESQSAVDYALLFALLLDHVQQGSRASDGWTPSDSASDKEESSRSGESDGSEASETAATPAVSTPAPAEVDEFGLGGLTFEPALEGAGQPDAAATDDAGAAAGTSGADVAAEPTASQILAGAALRVLLAAPARVLPALLRTVTPACASAAVLALSGMDTRMASSDRATEAAAAARIGRQWAPSTGEVTKHIVESLPALYASLSSSEGESDEADALDALALSLIEEGAASASDFIPVEPLRPAKPRRIVMGVPVVDESDGPPPSVVLTARTAQDAATGLLALASALSMLDNVRRPSLDAAIPSAVLLACRLAASVARADTGVEALLVAPTGPPTAEVGTSWCEPVVAASLRCVEAAGAAAAACAAGSPGSVVCGDDGSALALSEVLASALEGLLDELLHARGNTPAELPHTGSAPHAQHFHLVLWSTALRVASSLFATLQAARGAPAFSGAAGVSAETAAEAARGGAVAAKEALARFVAELRDSVARCCEAGSDGDALPDFAKHRSSVATGILSAVTTFASAQQRHPLVPTLLAAVGPPATELLAAADGAAAEPPRLSPDLVLQCIRALALALSHAITSNIGVEELVAVIIPAVVPLLREGAAGERERKAATQASLLAAQKAPAAFKAALAALTPADIGVLQAALRTALTGGAGGAGGARGGRRAGRQKGPGLTIDSSKFK